MSLHMSVPQSLRVVRVGGIYDLVVTVGFALPFTAPLVLTQFGVVHEALGLTGLVPDPTDPYVVMLANLMGSLVTVWSVLRAWRPSLLTGAADAVTRGLFSVALVAAMVAGASPLLLALLVPELVFGVGQAIAVALARRPVQPTPEAPVAVAAVF